MDAIAPAGGNNRNVPIGRVLLWTGAALPFLCSLGFHAAGPAAQPSAPGVERPALAFSHYAVDLGPVEPAGVVSARFAFTNRSPRAVTITELLPSCGCLNPKLEKRTYEPGESGEFSLHVQTANERPGPKEYFCKVRYDDSQNREVDLTFLVELPAHQVAVRPKSLILYQFNAQPQRERIVVTDYRAKPLRLTDARCTSKLVTVSIGAAARDVNGATAIPVAVDIAADVPVGRHPAWVVLSTDDEVFPELSVPLLIQRFDADAEAGFGSD